MVVANVDEYRRQIEQLLPEGLVWAGAAGTNLRKLLEGIAGEAVRVEGRACDLLVEADPRRTTELIAEWERMVGLPNSCIGELGSLEERRNAVVTILTNTGGQSPSYFVGFAGTLGFIIDIVENTEFRAGFSAAGDALTNGDWVFVWEVHAPFSTGISFTAGHGAAGDPLVTFGNSTLECLIEDHKPAHTQVDFFYDRGLFQPTALQLTLVVPAVKVFPLAPSPVLLTIVAPPTGGVILA